MGIYSIKISIHDTSHNNLGEETSFLLLKSVEDVNEFLKEAKSYHDRFSDVIGQDNEINPSIIQSSVRRCLEEPGIVHCEWFRHFLSNSSSSKKDSHLSACTLDSIACDFVLQPFDSDVVYIPRRRTFSVNHDMEEGDSLVWKFSFGSSTDISFRAMVVENNCEVVEVEKFSATREAGGSTGSYRASSPTTLRLTFDNTCSLFRGNYVDYCVQLVPEQTMLAAEKAAIDLADARARTSELYEALLQSTAAASFSVHVDAVAEGYDAEESLDSTSLDEGRTTKLANVSWIAEKALNTINGIPFAGKLVNNLGLVCPAAAVTDTTPSQLNNPVEEISSNNNNKKSNDYADGAGLLPEHTLKSGNLSDLCTVCGSGSVRDMLHLARQVDVLREECQLERALAVQAITAAQASSKTQLAAKDDIIHRMKDENDTLKLKSLRLDSLQSKAVTVEESHRLEMSKLQIKYDDCYEKLCSLQKEAGVWSVARGRVEEELCFLSNSKESESAERVAAVAQCASLKSERSELLQRIASLEQQLELANAAPIAVAATIAEIEQEKKTVAMLQAEVQALRIQKDVDDKKFSLLQAEFQAVVVSSRSEISEAKMLQYHHQEKLARLKSEKKLLISELRSLRDRGLYSTGVNDIRAVGTASQHLEVNAMHETATLLAECQCKSVNDRPECCDCVRVGAGGRVEDEEDNNDEDYCTERMTELLRREQVVAETLSMDSDSQALQDLSAQLRRESDNICSHSSLQR